MKSQAEEAGFAAAGEAGPAADVEEGRGGACAVVLNDLDVATLFDDEEASATVLRLLNIERIGKAGGHGNQIKSARSRRRHGQRSWGGAVAASTARRKHGQEKKGLTRKSTLKEWSGAGVHKFPLNSVYVAL
jgi:hypothetical protein